MDKGIFNPFRYVQYVDGNMNFSDEFSAVDKFDYDLLNTRNSKVMNSEEYELIQDSNGNLFICVKDIFKAYSYELYFNQTIYHISTQQFKEVNDLLQRTPAASYGEFTFTKSEPVYNPNTDRCDMSMKGPAVFLREGEQPLSKVFNSNVIATMSDLKRYVPILSVDGIGHVIYVELVDPDREEFDTNENTMPKATRTISELLKLMVEWRILKDSPFNSQEEITQTIDTFFKEIRLPNEIEQDLIQNQTDMQVARFLKGSDNARVRPPVEEVKPITDTLKRWILSKMFFNGYDSLKANLVI